MSRERLGVSGRFSAYFLDSPLTPLLALISLLVGAFAFVVMPREEEPQTNVTLVDVVIPYPGAGVEEVERTVLSPAEQLLARLPGLEHISGVAHPGVAMIGLQFKIEMPRSDALIELYSTIGAQLAQFMNHPGIQAPSIKVLDVDDVAIVALTLFSKYPEFSRRDLERVAHSMEGDLQRAPGVREVRTIGGPGWAVMIDLDPARLRAHDITVADLQSSLQKANISLPIGVLTHGNRSIDVDADGYVRSAEDIANLVVGVRNGQAVLLRQVADVREGEPIAENYVWIGFARDQKDLIAPSYKAVTLVVSKKTGENISGVVDEVLRRAEYLRNTVIPAQVEMVVTRDLGVAAKDNSQLLFEKLVLVTLSIVVLILIALGWREAAIVLGVVLLTLSVTLFCAWAFGFTLNRSSLFALIVSIGLLVDDAVVVIENIHRHHQRRANASLRDIIPKAVDEIGGPTVLATFTVIAALAPMLFVSGMPGEYFRPVPAITNTGMLISLLIALAVTPWLSLRWMRHTALTGDGAKPGLAERLAPLFTRFFKPLLDERRGHIYRGILGLIILGSLLIAVLLPVFQFVKFNLQPYSNKSDFQVLLDMPTGTPIEQTAVVLQELAARVATESNVVDYQIYAGTPGPYGTPGLLRKYYLRNDSEFGVLQVNLVDKHHRKETSHEMVVRLRSELTDIAARAGATIKVFDPPSGVPTMAPVVAEVYGPSAKVRAELAGQIRETFSRTQGLVDVSDSGIAAAPREVLRVDRDKAAKVGISDAQIFETLRAGLNGDREQLVHGGGKYPVKIEIALPATARGDLDTVLQLPVRGAEGQLVNLGELVEVRRAEQEQPIYHKDLLPMHFVLGDVDTEVSSPILGMLRVRNGLKNLNMPGLEPPTEYFVRQPDDPYRGYSYKWDGDWQLTYETFRDLGAAYIVGLVLIYLLIVSQFSSYLTPLIIMAPIPLTIVGINAGHALLGTEFTVSSMIGMMVLAGLLVRNSILLVDFINRHVADGMALKEAVVRSANVRAQPIILTSLAAMVAAVFLLSDPMFNGLAVALIFGNLVSTALTLIVIPTLYYAVYRGKFER
jgi:multidrug efflux pump subunit AcrB